MAKSPPKLKTKPPPLPSLTVDYFRRAQKGEKAAMADLFVRVRDRLNRFCLYLTGDRQSAQDLAQDAYVKVMENLKSLEDPNFFVPWLFRVTKNHFLDYVRSPRSRIHAGYQLLQYLPANTRNSELATQIAAALAQLKPRDRLLVLFIYLEGQSYADAAKWLGVTEEAVRGRLRRIREALRGDFFTIEKHL